MFATLFNQLFAIFGSVLSTRKILSFSPGFEESAHYAAAILLLLYVLIFGVLQVLAWFYFLKNREDYFPALLDKIAGGLLGFICGHLICSVTLLSLCIGLGPFFKPGKFNWVCTRSKIEHLTQLGVVNGCDFLAWYSLECFDSDLIDRCVDDLLAMGEHKDKTLPSLLTTDKEQHKDLLDSPPP
jgi:hypothetical protein